MIDWHRRITIPWWVIAGVALGLGMVAGVLIHQHRIKLQDRHPIVFAPTHDAEAVREPLIREGEWVTKPNGDRVCRVTRNIYRNDLQPSAWLRHLCFDWQEPPPPVGAPVQSLDWLQITTVGRQRLHVADRWVP